MANTLFRAFLALCCLFFSTCMLAKTSSVETHFESIKHDPKALHQFLHDMPKGGDLHFHLLGGVYPETILSYAQKHAYCLDKNTFVMKHALNGCTGISSKALTKNHPLYPRVLQAWSMQDFRPGKISGHDHFFEAFSKFLPVFWKNRGLFLAAVMQRAADQHERYLEIMLLPEHLPQGKWVHAPLEVKDFEKRYHLLMHDENFQKSIQQVHQEIAQMKNQAWHVLGCDEKPEQPVCHIQVKFQYHASRLRPVSEVFAGILQGMLLAKDEREIVGVNVVRAEDHPIALRDFKQQMAVFNFLHQHYPDVHIALHAGELPAKLGRLAHIHGAIFEGKAQRIGHGVDIASEPNYLRLLHHMSQHDIPVEINFSSNAHILEMTGQAHPFKLYLTHHVPLVLSTDDEGILRTSLTQEYQKAVEEQGVDYNTLKRLSRDALTYAFLPGKSVWKPGHTGTPVTACQQFDSPPCHRYLANSPKAQLQRQLELDFLAFEKRFKGSHHATNDHPSS